jgi:uncharacterized repeat protein (TIGR03803 family)
MRYAIVKAIAATALLWSVAAAVEAGAKTHILYRFSGGADGASPIGPLVSDAAGNLFGITENGGGNNAGTIFELTPNRGQWSVAVLHDFGPSDGGEHPYTGLISDQSGNLYGVTAWTDDNCDYYCGVAFELARGQGTWTYSVLHSFGGFSAPDGGEPNGQLLLDNRGNLFGTTTFGGSSCINSPPCGVIFKLSQAGGVWNETVLYGFRSIPDGAFPYGGLAEDAHGNLFGTTSEGGTGRCHGEGTMLGCGTVFEFSHRTSAESVLYSFHRSEQNGPGGSLVFGPDGALYGTAGYDVFRVARSRRGKWAKQTIYEFTEGIGGTIPSGPPVFDSSGNIYLTTTSSGLYGYSTVSELSPPQVVGDPWTGTTLATFSTGFDGDFPHGGVLLGPKGEIYGVASGDIDAGYVFKVVR